MAKFAKQQPKDGDCVFHCGHPKAKNHHFYMFASPTKVILPDGQNVDAKWIILCNRCHHLCNGNPH